MSSLLPSLLRGLVGSWRRLVRSDLVGALVFGQRVGRDLLGYVCWEEEPVGRRISGFCPRWSYWDICWFIKGAAAWEEVVGRCAIWESSDVPVMGVEIPGRNYCSGYWFWGFRGSWFGGLALDFGVMDATKRCRCMRLFNKHNSCFMRFSFAYQSSRWSMVLGWVDELKLRIHAVG